MSPEQQRIKIAEACGWEGVPCQQKWLVSSRVKYWRSVTPEEVIDEIKEDNFGCSLIARWLKTPEGKPFVLRKQYAGDINNFATFTDKVVIQDFSSSEWAESANYNGYKFQTDPWPEVSPSLKPFVKYLPNYPKDLNAMHEAEKILGDKWDVYQCMLSNLQSGLRHDARSHWSDVGSGFVSHATAAQRAEAFLKTLNLWKQ